MNTATGDIRHFLEGEPIPQGYVPLKQLPDANCRECGGKGKFLKKKPGKRGVFYYEPCTCTQ